MSGPAHDRGNAITRRDDAAERDAVAERDDNAQQTASWEAAVRSADRALEALDEWMRGAAARTLGDDPYCLRPYLQRRMDPFRVPSSAESRREIPPEYWHTIGA